MNNQSPVSRELLIPILLGGFSILGIVVVLIIGRALNAPAEIAATPSSTPFQYIYLGTEPAVTTLVVEGSDIAPSTEETVAITSVFATPTRGLVSTPIILRTNTPGGLPTSNSNNAPPTSNSNSGPPIPTVTRTASAANTYDDTDSRLTYSGDWIAQTGLSETGPNPAYQGTLHISNVAGSNSVTFSFTGQEIDFFYQSGPTSGTVTIYLDNDPLGITVSEAQGNGVWVHVLATAGSHTIKIVHTSGASINIDKFVIPAATPTPTRTPTP